jgi:tRNA (adenine57-N1/adenine58-N1)-methyltransferase
MSFSVVHLICSPQVLLLAPTPDLWTYSLKHRTQILYPTDIALILSELHIKPGSVVLESGTGSGSLSSSFARTLAPHGHLHTFEFNAQRVLDARADFAMLGLDANVVSVYWRDVCGNGFPLVDEGVDAVFLDLPAPHATTLVQSIVRNLRPMGRLCSFSPCMEQVQRMCVALAQNGFQGAMLGGYWLA